MLYLAHTVVYKNLDWLPTFKTWKSCFIWDHIKKDLDFWFIFFLIMENLRTWVPSPQDSERQKLWNCISHRDCERLKGKRPSSPSCIPAPDTEPDSRLGSWKFNSFPFVSCTSFKNKWVRRPIQEGLWPWLCINTLAVWWPCGPLFRTRFSNS